MIYLRFVATLIVYGLAYLIGMIVHPFMYAMRNRKRPGGFLYWWSNVDEKGGGDPERAFIDNWYGVYEIFDRDYERFNRLSAWRKYWLSYEWLALRNSHFVLKKKLYNFETPFKISKVIKFEGDSSALIWRNGTIGGVSHVIVEDAKGRESFRYSRTWGKVKGDYLYVQLGAGNSRYHIKFRRGKLAGG